jgi:hypothetical protein
VVDVEGPAVLEDCVAVDGLGSRGGCLVDGRDNIGVADDSDNAAADGVVEQLPAIVL